MSSRSGRVLADDKAAAEYQLRDRFFFLRFLGLGLEDAVPDAKTLWLYREALARADAVEELFDLFDGFLRDRGYLARGGQIIDATIVSAPKQHKSRKDNETIKEGETPEDWKSKPAKNRQKDKDARWTKSTNAHISVTRTISASIGGTNSCAVTR
jgi:IS5 family transposase